MKARWAALVTVLALHAFTPKSTEAQGSQRQGRDPATGSTLGQNYPNPFASETTIPFTVGGWPECQDASKQYRVTLRVYNMLAQFVANPTLQSASAGVAGGQPVRDLGLTCGQYTAFWDGKYANAQRDAAGGVYLYRLEVDGRPVVRKMLMMK